MAIGAVTRTAQQGAGQERAPVNPSWLNQGDPLRAKQQPGGEPQHAGRQPVWEVPSNSQNSSKQGRPDWTVRRPDASMTLLTEMMERPLDPSYAEAAANRENANTSKRSWFKLMVALGGIALGFAVTAAVGGLRLPAPVAREARLALEQQITNRNNDIATATENLDLLNKDIAELQEAALGAANYNLMALIAADGLRNGSVPVAGPGLVVTLIDGGTGGLVEQSPDSLVRDSDIQHVVQALWAAGAEAIAVGDQRLTMTSAIRNAGAAVLVDLVPVLGPNFEITAIGDPAELEARVAASTVPAYLQFLANEYGIRSTITQEPELQVPAAAPHILHYATETQPGELPAD